MRSDKLKSHMIAKHSTPKKKKPEKPVNKSPQKRNQFIVSEADHSSLSEREQNPESDEEDRLFIDDSYIEVKYFIRNVFF